MRKKHSYFFVIHLDRLASCLIAENISVNKFVRFWSLLVLLFQLVALALSTCLTDKRVISFEGALAHFY